MDVKLKGFSSLGVRALGVAKVCLFLAYSVFCLLLSVVIYSDEPRTVFSYRAPLLLVCSAIILIPGALFYLVDRLSLPGWKFINAGRFALFVVLFVYVVSGVGEHAAKKEEIIAEQFERMTPDEKLAEIERRSRAEEERRVAGLNKYVNETKLEEGSEEEEIKSENDRQSDFFEDLSAPKILYRCGGSPLVKAYGAKFGSYNLLLESAYRDCGSGSVDVIDSEK